MARPIQDARLPHRVHSCRNLAIRTALRPRRSPRNRSQARCHSPAQAHSPARCHSPAHNRNPARRRKRVPIRRRARRRNWHSHRSAHKRQRRRDSRPVGPVARPSASPDRRSPIGLPRHGQPAVDWRLACGWPLAVRWRFARWQAAGAGCSVLEPTEPGGQTPGRLGTTPPERPHVRRRGSAGQTKSAIAKKGFPWTWATSESSGRAPVAADFEPGKATSSWQELALPTPRQPIGSTATAPRAFPVSHSCSLPSRWGSPFGVRFHATVSCGRRASPPSSDGPSRNHE